MSLAKTFRKDPGIPNMHPLKACNCNTCITPLITHMQAELIEEALMMKKRREEERLRQRDARRALHNQHRDLDLKDLQVLCTYSSYEHRNDFFP